MSLLLGRLLRRLPTTRTLTPMTTQYEPGDWVRYRHHEGFTVTRKVLDERPDGILVTGEQNGDPHPDLINPEDVIEEVTVNG